jgi:tRNA pseudouridine32 synthase/23S rRNA pseudouridine746 synthase
VSELDLLLLHADEQLIVVHKPAGLLSVPGRGPDKQDCVWHRVRLMFPDALVVHRLDQATSGLLVLARGIEAQRQLSQSFATRQVTKRYLAWVQGHPDELTSGTLAPARQSPDATSPLATESVTEPATESATWSVIDLPIAADWPNRPRQIISAEGRPSLTRWRVLERLAAPDRALLELEPHTGRSHQLRVHLQALGHPILGDALYSPADGPASERLQLHAWRLSLPHPVSRRPLAFEAPLPIYWGQIQS